ncbi:hypothetical protein AB1Y20_010806 [Prymnesium parvum]|uniref:Uncharacterized protein n=1 Tax=Prymnesium parvum TaxID=97485 RepID=A0AB34ITU4_PRYPA
MAAARCLSPLALLHAATLIHCRKHEAAPQPSRARNASRAAANSTAPPSRSHITPRAAAQLICYARNYPDLVSAYCVNGNVSNCYLPGLDWHWKSVGQPRGATNACSASQEPASLSCWAQSYPQLLARFCEGDVTRCNIDALRNHWAEVGESLPLSQAQCRLSDEVMQCYAMNYPELKDEYCAGPTIVPSWRVGSVPPSPTNDLSSCDMDGLKWRWCEHAPVPSCRAPHLALVHRSCYTGTTWARSTATRASAGRRPTSCDAASCAPSEQEAHGERTPEPRRHVCAADAKNYDDLLTRYCQSRRLHLCDLEGLQWHWQHKGWKQGYKATCLQPEPIESLRCYAENYPSVHEGFCHRDSSKCDFAALQVHWVSVRTFYRGRVCALSTEGVLQPPY